MQRNFKKMTTSAVLVIAMLMVTMLPTTAFAASSKNVTPLPTSAGSTLSSGYIYTVKANTTITAASTQNALNVASGATVTIDIAQGYTLTVNGGAGSNRNAGGAGIYLPANATLIITGSGRLVANGGRSGNSIGGYPGDSGQFAGNAYTGAGGAGGGGAGGAGAGIGGVGGTGGAGGTGGSNISMYYPDYYADHNGYAGNVGGTGGTGSAMGTLYVLGSVSVVATGGGSTSGSGGGNAGTYTYRTFYTNKNFFHTLSGGGGGGGGGSTLSAAAIGGGSGGAGGGGGAGSGASYNTTSNWWAHSGFGGYGGYGGSNGATALQEGTCGRRGGAGGGGGGMGNSGAAGTVYKSSTATISGRSANAVATTHLAVSSVITFDNQEGVDGAQSLNVVFGSAMGNITIPTKDMHAFMGYYTSPNGQGTRYFDHRGVPVTPYYGTDDITLYAYWVQQQFNVTLNPQSGSGGTASIVTTGNDGTFPTGITIPTRANYKFGGYFQNAASQGVKYYDENGVPTGNKIIANATVYAGWIQMKYPISFNQQGGSGGTDSILTESNDGTLPAITAPTRAGFVFDGYFAEAYGKGTKYYNSDASPIATEKLTASANALYAYWTPANYTITYELGGGNNGANPTTRNYGNNTTIVNPTKNGYTFVGWTINNGTQTHKDLVITAGDITYAKNLTLTAKWLLGTTENETDAVISTEISGSVTNADEIKETLKGVFSYIVTENEKGITADDMSGDKSIKLVMNVNVSQSQEDEANIAGNAQGTVLKFYDLKVEKQVTDSTGTTITTNLKELPVPVTVKIPTSGDLSGKTAYSVYRVHGSATEKLPVQAGVNGEFSDLDGNGDIVITTRKFSTYGIVGAETSIGGDANTGDLTHTGQGLDVQGRVIEGTGGKVYKIDIVWGPMVFEYSLQQEWDPEAHMYTEGALNDWRRTGFDGINNKVVAVNHSNGHVKVNFSANSLLSGVATSMHIYNDKTADEAKFFILSDAPIGSTNAELVPCAAYMYLDGPPQNDWINANKDAYVKAGLITVTVEAYPDP